MGDPVPPSRRRAFEFAVPGVVVEAGAYGGPILPGQGWRSRGTSGHNHYQVTVLRRSAGGKVVFQSHKPGRRADGRRHSLDEGIFRAHYALEKQVREAALEEQVRAYREAEQRRRTGAQHAGT